MCVIVHEKAGKRLGYEEYFNALDNNSHGFGWIEIGENGIASGKVVPKNGKFFTQGEMKKLARQIVRHDKLERVLHFRLATNGAKTLVNTHPFPVFVSDFEVDGLLVHNGVFSQYAHDADTSDTRLFIRNYLEPSIKLLETNAEDVLESIDWLVNKIAYVNKHTRSVSCYGSFCEIVDGVTASNTHSFERCSFESYSGWRQKIKVWDRDAQEWTWVEKYDRDKHSSWPSWECESEDSAWDNCQRYDRNLVVYQQTEQFRDDMLKASKDFKKYAFRAKDEGESDEAYGIAYEIWLNRKYAPNGWAKNASGLYLPEKTLSSIEEENQDAVESYFEEKGTEFAAEVKTAAAKTLSSKNTDLHFETSQYGGMEEKLNPYVSPEASKEEIDRDLLRENEEESYFSFDLSTRSYGLLETVIEEDLDRFLSLLRQTIQCELIGKEYDGEARKIVIRF